MIAYIPKFVSPANWKRTGSGRWKYSLQKDLVVNFDTLLTSAPMKCVDKYGRVWLEIHRYSLVVKEGYSCNGSSCAPDSPNNMLASFVHDALYQFSGLFHYTGIKIDRKMADDIYAACCKAAKFRLTCLYRAGLSWFSWIFWGNPPESGEKILPLFG